MTDFESVDLTRDERGVATIVLRRPEAKNAMNMVLKRDLAAAITEVKRDDDVRAVIVTGSGDAFCAGGDIVEMELNDRPTRSRDRLRYLLEDLYVPLAEMEKPSIAAVNGHAHGSGLSLAMACDVVVASSSAVVSCAFAKVGLVPDCGALYFLPRRVGIGKAKELVFSGRRVKADEALQLGLVDRVVSLADLQDNVQEMAWAFAAMPTRALGMAKRLLDTSTSSTLREMAELEAYAQSVAYSTADHTAARESFVTKTAATFTGS